MRISVKAWNYLTGEQKQVLLNASTNKKAVQSLERLND